MLRISPARWLALLPALAALAAAAQDAAPPTALSFRSALEGYRAFSDEKTLPWKEANDTVGRIGGWRVYAREAVQAAPPAAEPGAASPPGKTGGHEAHHGGKP